MRILKFKKKDNIFNKLFFQFKILFIVLLGSLALILFCNKSGEESEDTLLRKEGFRFRHHFIEQKLENASWGQTSLADVDRDGDLDFVLGRAKGEVIWYEYIDADTWKQYKICDKSPSGVGGIMFDIDGDGWLDMIASGAWYQNPREKEVNCWSEYVFDPELSQVHDIITADLDGDGSVEIVTMSGKFRAGITRSKTLDLRWYKIPPDPYNSWLKNRIGDSIHAGIAAGDIDRDGDIDIVRSNVWFENKGGGMSWSEHQIVNIPWDLECKIEVCDINKDGRLDIVLTEAEILGARAAWFEAPINPKKDEWTAHILEQSDDEERGPYHSMAVADFDNDGDLDIFSGEMEHLGVKPYRWFIWENISHNGNPEFVERVILDIGLGTHEAVIGDVDGDGDIDICGKLWRPKKDNSNEGSNHADFLENLLISK